MRHAHGAAVRLRMLRAVLGNGALLRLEVVWAAVTLVRWALAILVALYAYRAGGAEAVGVVAVARIARQPCWRRAWRSVPTGTHAASCCCSA